MLTPLCRRRSSHLQRSRSTTPEIRRCHTPQHEAQISMLQRPRRVRPLLPPLGRAVFVGKSRHSRLQHPRSPSPNDTPPTPVRALQTPLGHKSDAHGNDNVVLRNAPSLQQKTETSSAASKARRHCYSTRTCRPPSLVLAETARPCDVRIHRAHSQRHWPSRLRPSQDSKPLACQPLCRRGHFNLRQIPSTHTPLRPLNCTLHQSCRQPPWWWRSNSRLARALEVTTRKGDVYPTTGVDISSRLPTASKWLPRLQPHWPPFWL